MKTLKTDCHKKAGGNMSGKNDYNYINSYPNDDGFYMPAEFEFHKGTIIIWPKRPGSWIYGAVKAREAFANVVCAISIGRTYSDYHGDNRTPHPWSGIY